VRTAKKTVAVMAAVMSSALCLAACGSSTKAAAKPTTTTTAVTSTSTSTSTASYDLANVCPNPLQIAVDWAPEVEQSAYYELAKPTGGDINSSAKTYTAPLIDPFNGKSTGIDVDVEAGGPAVGYLHPEQILYERPSVLIGAGESDTQVVDYSKTPTVAIFAPFHIDPVIFDWNPKKYDFKSIAAIGKSNVTVQYYAGSGYMAYLIAKGIIKKSQTFSGYNGSYARFVSTGGGVVDQGFATEGPYKLTHMVPAWDKSTAYALIASTGYDPYELAAFTTPQNLKKYSGCFKKLVPMMQEAQIKYLEHPGPVNKLILKLIDAFGIGKPYNAGLEAYADKTMLEDKLMHNASNGVFGYINMSRVQTYINELVDSKAVTNLPSGFKASSVATDKFIDPKIHMTFYTGPYKNPNGVIIVKGTK
jgi:hypothetical protein